MEITQIEDRLRSIVGPVGVTNKRDVISFSKPLLDTGDLVNQSQMAKPQLEWMGYGRMMTRATCHTGK